MNALYLTDFRWRKNPCKRRIHRPPLEVLWTKYRLGAECTVESRYRCHPIPSLRSIRWGYELSRARTGRGGEVGDRLPGRSMKGRQKLHGIAGPDNCWEFKLELAAHLMLVC